MEKWPQSYHIMAMRSFHLLKNHVFWPQDVHFGDVRSYYFMLTGWIWPHALVSWKERSFLSKQRPIFAAGIWVFWPHRLIFWVLRSNPPARMLWKWPQRFENTDLRSFCSNSSERKPIVQKNSPLHKNQPHIKLSDYFKNVVKMQSKKNQRRKPLVFQYFGGEYGARTRDLLTASQTRSQLR